MNHRVLAAAARVGLAVWLSLVVVAAAPVPAQDSAEPTPADPIELWKTLADVRWVEGRSGFGSGPDMQAAEMRLEHGEALVALDGTVVSLVGVMAPLEKTAEIRRFLLAKIPGPGRHSTIGPEARVEVLTAAAVRLTRAPVLVRGTLELLEDVDDGWFYRLNDATLLDVPQGLKVYPDDGHDQEQGH